MSHDKARQAPCDPQLVWKGGWHKCHRVWRVLRVVQSSSMKKSTCYVPRPIKEFTSIIWLIFTITLPGRDYDPCCTVKEKEAHTDCLCGERGNPAGRWSSKIPQWFLLTALHQREHRVEKNGFTARENKENTVTTKDSQCRSVNHSKINQLSKTNT